MIDEKRLDELISDVSDGGFDCGEYDLDAGDEEEYQHLLDVSKQAKCDLKNWVISQITAAVEGK